MEEFDYNKFVLENKGKKFVKIEKYPKGVDKFDESIIDLFFDLTLSEKNMSYTVFEKVVMRKYIEQSTNKSFMQRIKELNQKGIPIQIFPEEATAMKIGYKKQKDTSNRDKK